MSLAPEVVGSCRRGKPSWFRRAKRSFTPSSHRFGRRRTLGLESLERRELLSVVPPFGVAESATESFSNTGAISIAAFGAATPYPSAIAVSGVTDPVSDVNVTITGLMHGYPDDVDILLVGPGGQTVLLMSDTGGGDLSFPVTLTFDDEAAGALPDSGTLSTGSFRPTNYGASADTFSSPAPSGPYGSTLDVFDALDPNGQWQLYVYDDAGGDSGSISGGWSLTFTTDSTLGTIAGSKWNDLNADGQWDTGEPGMAGWTIYCDLDQNGAFDDGEPYDITAVDGSYAIAGLAAGTYTVAEVPQAGWEQTFPALDGGESLVPEAADNDPVGVLTIGEETPVDIDVESLVVVDESNPVVAVDPPPDPSVPLDVYETLPSEAPPYPLDQTFLLHSNPGATKVIYLDFDGHTTTGTLWNNKYGDPIVTPAYTLDGDSGNFSNAELEQIQKVWERVSEDYLPFNIDVTTEDPGVEALRNTGGGDTQWGIRVVIGENTWYGSAGGVAYLYSFDWSSDTPCFVFNTGETGVAEAASHEAGHTVGLSHDGNSSVDYYAGHGSGATSWAPIMGVGYYVQLVQWSQGEYPDANNTENDLSIMTTGYGFSYRTDDHGGTSGTATELVIVDDAFSGEGIIERTTDVDYFSFTIVAADVTIDIDPFYRSPNLDVLATLYDASGAIAASNPISALDASFSVTLAAGTYYLSIDGTGKAAEGSDPGYTDYASLGYYSISGTIEPTGLPGTHTVVVGEGQVVPDINFGNHMDLPGDASLDGVVGEDDASILAAHWGMFDAVWTDGDFNDDGKVNAADAAIMAANWGATTIAEMPEPAADAAEPLIGPVLLTASSATRRLIEPARDVVELAAPPAAIACDAVMAREYGPRQTDRANLAREHLAWSYTLARRQSPRASEKADKDSVAVDLLLAGPLA